MTTKQLNGAGIAILIALILVPVAVNINLLGPLALAITLSAAAFLWRYKVTAVWPAFWRRFLADELGAVSVLYFARGAGGLTILGSATGPTAIQAQQCFTQTVQVNMSDTDVQALFTHSWGLDASAPGYFLPEIFYYAQMMTANGTWATALTFDVTNTNVIKINKPNFAQSGGTWIVTARRPHSTGQ